MTLSLSNPALFVERAYIGGAWVGTASGATVPVDNPATGAIIGTVPDCSAADTQAAIDAAEAAFPAWKARTASDRAAMLERWHALVMDNLVDLGRIMTAEQGKPTAEAEGEIRYAASFIKWFAEEARRIDGGIIPAPEANRRILVMKEPVGVSAAITPWNFPSAMITRKCAPALAAGCPVVVKPSELTPYSALAMAKLAEEAGFPAGVFNVVTGLPTAIGGALTASPVVRKLSFTGSTRVGALLMRQCADTIKRVSFELGGNAPLIIFDDADIDLAVASAMVSKFRNAGQTCVCANRILVQDGVYDQFAEKLAKAVSALKVAPGDMQGSTIGPLINTAAAEKVKAHVDDALSHGATLFAQAPEGATGERFARPVVLTGATRDMRLAEEETFGPVAPLFRFTHEDEGIELANATSYGLASYFYTENLHRAFRVAERLEAGMVALNTGSIAMEVAPFGGVKMSGLGREGAHAGIEEYLETKAFHIGGLKI
ncbi:MAG: NAD-dependent succinate-semialdehyde dehydrogenase [Sphingobium sp.]|jgi:succinate-semialdehyde dehydrogenase / glutarate-semialdehyde dehydrogenase|uniref:NAD-dependent succinate-semialdehyde dehydrogenase n=1 Tax=Sphingobium xenophagum TaxID=121428 RepID=A0A249MXW4_SPHXE|nr:MULTISPECIES: NAD-dependent succinate-semialdehyde dehydrogenase [Sphingobium]MBU0660138.1 NAD-dependent succinate-semialdehyde dehydrogenase [Alphaproteobacteria bacterium]ASY46112.1 NAD-dependent succinate-semialdehyde dehydrogenase [Sphingobium xenophagum]MBA4756422.1 NAD-dependent succinate-semialdehyde dehydrogenase [Sphingobium sp.]MBS91154.1 NAD-dependent succinate-semialdehyde dehydrogenase [Sphingobium sp.]MBU0775207.1 NAD-dependent succinate-semialdehyde dehydrogenase [Alphaproteo